jgi:hypothetical protein
MRVDIAFQPRHFRGAEVLHEPAALNVTGRFAWDDHHVAAGAVVTAGT